MRGALRDGTAAALRAVVRRWAVPRGPLAAFLRQPDDQVERAIRVMVLEEPALADLHAAARDWLAGHDAAPSPAITAGRTRSS